jgi:hypothetical protein
VEHLSLSSGGALDLRLITYNKSGTVSFTENKTHTAGTLTVTEGSLKQTLTLFGQYAAAGFSLSKDSGGGTAITYAPISAAHTPLALHH